VVEICQNRTADKGQFFRGFSVAQIKKCKTNESLEITWGICTRNLRSKRYSDNFNEFLRYSTEICFRTTTSPNLTSLKLEVSHNNEIKMIGEVITEVITSKTQITEKELKIKQWVISQECFSLTPLS
jgi:hypothetical protein